MRTLFRSTRKKGKDPFLLDKLEIFLDHTEILLLSKGLKLDDVIYKAKDGNLSLLIEIKVKDRRILTLAEIEILNATLNQWEWTDYPSSGILITDDEEIEYILMLGEYVPKSAFREPSILNGPCEDCTEENE